MRKEPGLTNTLLPAAANGNGKANGKANGISPEVGQGAGRLFWGQLTRGATAPDPPAAILHS